MRYRLRREDFYGLVMVDRAKIPRSQDGLLEFGLEWLPFEIIELVVITLGFLVVFRHSVVSLYLPDWVRWLVYPLFVWLVLYIGRVWQKIRDARATKQIKTRGR